MNSKIDQANIAYENGDFQRVISICQDILTENPKDTLVRCKLTDSLIKLGDYKSALQETKKTLEIEPDLAEAQYQTAYAYFMLNEIKKGEDFVRKAIKGDPDSSKSYELLGCILLQNNDKTSIQYFQRAIELDNGNWHKHYLLGMAYSKNNFPKEAYKEILTAYKLQPSIKTFLNVVNLWLFLNQLWVGMFIGGIWIVAQMLNSLLLTLAIFLIFILGGLMNIYFGHKKRGYLLMGVGLLTLIYYLFTYQWY